MRLKNIEAILKNLTQYGSWWNAYEQETDVCELVLLFADKTHKTHTLIKQFFPDFNY